MAGRLIDGKISQLDFLFSASVIPPSTFLVHDGRNILRLNVNCEKLSFLEFPFVLPRLCKLRTPLERIPQKGWINELASLDLCSDTLDEIRVPLKYAPCLLWI
jgi:hypothetical protein